MTPGTWAPVVVFAYARPAHTARTLAALAANEGATETDLIVYADGPKTEAVAPQVAAVREIVADVQGFRSVRVVAREANVGLAANIIEGVTNTVQDYGRVIVVEDDIVTAPKFLSFMNRCLDAHQDNAKVWHVSGWNYPIASEGLEDVFLYRAMHCWGWATWADRWAHYQRDPAALIAAWDEPAISHFNLDGTHDFWRQVVENRDGVISTWAIFWHATIAARGGLCLHPARSYVTNIGFDDSGHHTGADDEALWMMPPEALCQDDVDVTLPLFDEHAEARCRIKAFYASLPDRRFQNLGAKLLRFHRTYTFRRAVDRVKRLLGLSG